MRQSVVLNVMDVYVSCVSCYHRAGKHICVWNIALKVMCLGFEKILIHLEISTLLESTTGVSKKIYNRRWLLLHRHCMKMWEFITMNYRFVILREPTNTLTVEYIIYIINYVI